MLIGQHGAMNPAQEQQILLAQQESEHQEKQRARLSKLSKLALLREVRHEMNTTGKTNHLAFCYGLGLLAILGGDALFTGADPYCRQHKKMPKRTRMRTRTATTAAKA